MLMPGSYCILTDPIQQTILPTMQDFTVGNDEHLVDINFYMPNPAPPPSPTPVCTSDLPREACEAAGGTMSTSLTTAPYCICP